MRRVLLAVGLSLASVALLVAQPPAAESPAAAAARKRQEAIKSVEFVFKVEEIAEPGCMSDFADKKAVGKLFPSRQIRTESLNRLVVQGKSLRYENNHPTPDSRTLAWEDTREVFVSDGETVKLFYRPKGEVSRQNSFGIINTPKGNPVGTELIVLPMMFAVRGADPEMCASSISGIQWLSTGTSQSTTGDFLDGFRRNLGSRDSVEILVSPKNGYALTRYRRLTSGGRVATQLDVISKSDEQSGVVLPAKWKQILFGNTGAVRRTFDVTVREVRVGASRPKSEFDLEFPVGMEVDDQRNGKSFVVGPTGSLLGLSGPGGPVLPGGSSWKWWLLLPVTILVAAGVRQWVRRRR
jgi:outer membrane lipoprotein-sorting protein